MNCLVYLVINMVVLTAGLSNRQYDSLVASILSTTTAINRVEKLFVSPNKPPDPTFLLTQLQKYDVVLVYIVFEKVRTLFGDVLAQYVDGGGAVVEGYYGVMSGRWQQEDYGCMRISPPGNPAVVVGGPLHLGKRITDHPILTGAAGTVTRFDGGRASTQQRAYTITPGTSVVAEWTNGKPLVLTKSVSKRGNVAYLNFNLLSSAADANGWDASTQGGQLIANTVLWAVENEKQ